MRSQMEKSRDTWKSLYDQMRELYEQRCASWQFLQRDYNRMKSLWLADIKRNGDQHHEIEKLNRLLDFEPPYCYLRSANDQVSAAKVRIADLEAKVREASVGNERLAAEVKHWKQRKRFRSNDEVAELQREKDQLLERNDNQFNTIVERDKEIERLKGHVHDADKYIREIRENFSRRF